MRATSRYITKHLENRFHAPFYEESPMNRRSTAFFQWYQAICICSLLVRQC